MASDNTFQARRMTEVSQQWFLAEPLFFGAWTTHQVVPNGNIQTIRVGRGRIEFNPEFLETLDNRTLRDVMKFEALRIILKHPYERRRPNARYAWEASNLAIGECTRTSLSLPSAKSKFHSDAHSHKHFEYYYNLLVGLSSSNDPSNSAAGTAPNASDAKEDRETEEGCESDGERDSDAVGESKSQFDLTQNQDSDCESGNANGDSASAKPNNGKTQQKKQEPDAKSKCSGNGCGLGGYCDAALVGLENASIWEQDQFITQQINDLISEIEASQSWGTVAGKARELILATRVPRLDYRRVLKSFRANVLSTSRCLTRMKPSRRYGFECMGSKRDFTTNLLFAVDVSGSVGTPDIRHAFSIVNRLFKYGIESIDVIWFDTDVRNEQPLTLRKAQQQLYVDGRGGTNFQPLMDYLDEHRTYDGLIVSTDGIAPVPRPPKQNRQTRIAWLFNHEKNWQRRHRELEQPGMVSAFVLSD